MLGLQGIRAFRPRMLLCPHALPFSLQEKERKRLRRQAQSSINYAEKFERERTLELCGGAATVSGV